MGKKRILITGATGFVGANLIKELVKENNYEIHILTRETSNIWRIKSEYNYLIDYKVDLTNEIKLKEVVKKINPEYIVHLAIYGGRPRESEIEKIIDSNLLGTINLINAVKDIDFKIFINTGSSSEYGSSFSKMKENDLCNPDTLYGITKLASTLYCNSIAKKTNKNICTVRLFSPFGDLEEKGRLFPDLIINSIKGEDIELANPNSVRDFIYVGEVIEFYKKLLEEHPNVKGEIFNLGYGEEHSVSYCAKKVLEYTNSDSKLYYYSKKEREFDTEKWEASMEKTNKILNWKSSLNFDEQIRKSCEWYKNNLEKYEDVIE